MGSKQTTRNWWVSRRGPAALILIGALALTACSGSDDDASTGAEASFSVEQMGAEDSGATVDGSFLGSDEAGDAAAGDQPATAEGGFDIGVIGRDVIIEVRVVMTSDDIQRSVASIMASAATLGGGIASSDVNYDTSDVTGSEGFAVLVVNIPPASVDRLLSGLGDTGMVESINQSAQDVTEQLVDLDVRIENARRSVVNVREFMDRTENLNELVTLEAELTRRQTELEQLEAQERNLADRVALSTVTIEIIPSASAPDLPVDEDESIGDALRSGWDAFVAVLFGIGFVLAATLPFLISGVLLTLIIWIVVRRGDTRRVGPLQTHGAPAGEPVRHDTEAEADADADEPEPVG